MRRARMAQKGVCARSHTRKTYMNLFHTHLRNSKGRVGRKQVLLLSSDVCALDIVDVLAPARRGVLACRVHVHLPHDAWLAALVRHAHELLCLVSQEGRGEEPRDSERLANLVETSVQIRQAPASVRHAIWRELDHLHVSAARNQQRVDGTDDYSQVL